MAATNYCELVYVQENGRLNKKVRECIQNEPEYEESSGIIPPSRRFRSSCEDPSKCVNKPQLLSCIPSLFEFALDFIVNNFHLVESLVGLPSTIGEMLSNQVLNKLKDGHQSGELKHVFRVFLMAYNQDFLSGLSIQNNSTFLDEHLVVLVTGLSHLTELNLTGCLLGDDHCFFSHIGTATNIQCLSLRNNNLTDCAVRRLALPTITLEKGPCYLRNLDLSYNKISARSVPYLKCFKKLDCLDLSDTLILNSTFVNKTLGLVMDNTKTKGTIQTRGWAALYLESLMERCVISDMQFWENSKCKFYGLLKPERTPSDATNKFIFVKPAVTQPATNKSPDNPSKNTCNLSEHSHKTSPLNKHELHLLSLYSNPDTSTLPYTSSCLWEI